jgi:hypothetical protein
MSKTECRDRVLNLPESSHFSKCKIGTNLFLLVYYYHIETIFDKGYANLGQNRVLEPLKLVFFSPKSEKTGNASQLSKRMITILLYRPATTV